MTINMVDGSIQSSRKDKLIITVAIVATVFTRIVAQGYYCFLIQKQG